jgi:hypothetical protein
VASTGAAGVAATAGAEVVAGAAAAGAGTEVVAEASAGADAAVVGAALVAATVLGEVVVWPTLNPSRAAAASMA